MTAPPRLPEESEEDYENKLERISLSVLKRLRGREIFKNIVGGGLVIKRQDLDFPVVLSPDKKKKAIHVQINFEGKTAVYDFFPISVGKPESIYIVKIYEWVEAEIAKLVKKYA